MTNKKSYTNTELKEAIAAFRKANPEMTPVVGSSEDGTTITGIPKIAERTAYSQLTEALNDANCPLGPKPAGM